MERYQVIKGERFWYVADKQDGWRLGKRFYFAKNAHSYAAYLNRWEEIMGERKREAQETPQEGAVASKTGGEG